MQTYDFQRSFLTFSIDLDRQKPLTLSCPSPYRVNTARVMLECVCSLTDCRSGTKTLYVLGASCKTELVGVPRDIWTQPNADMCVVVSNEEFVILKSWQNNDIGVKRYPESLGVQPERQVGSVADAWVELLIEPHTVDAEVLATPDEIHDATRAGRALIARIEYNDGDYRVRIDHPVKTINVNSRDKIFQTDTGPLIVPDLTPERIRSSERLIGVFDQAYAAFNGPGWAEFIINTRTSLADGMSVNHYSKSRRIENTSNVIFAL